MFVNITRHPCHNPPAGESFATIPLFLKILAPRQVLHNLQQRPPKKLVQTYMHNLRKRDAAVKGPQERQKEPGYMEFGRLPASSRKNEEGE